MTRRQERRRKQPRAHDPIARLYEKRNAFVRARFERCPPELAPCEAAALADVRTRIDAAEMADAKPFFARAEAEIARLNALAAQIDALQASMTSTATGEESE